MPKINAERLIGDLKRLRQFGAKPPGVVRPAFSEADMEARKWLKDQYTEAGLEASIDGIGNVLGRSKNPGPALSVSYTHLTLPTKWTV